MEAVYNLINDFTNWLWGIPILIVLVGGGIILTMLIGGAQFTRFGFILKNTLGTLFDKEIQNSKKAVGVTPAQAVVAALGGTVGTGNIVGVGAAIAAGGPGALFWMWICGFVAMAIKYVETTLSVAYREKQSDGSYKAGPYMYIEKGLHCKPLAVAFSVASLVTLAIICAVHASSISNNLYAIGVSKIVTTGILVLFAALVIVGGVKGLVKITDIMVPLMSGIYLIAAVIVVLLNIGQIGTVFAEIFAGAFSGTAAIGGFVGATINAAIRNGLARGVFSNDAGLGLSASVQAQAEAIDHPAQQGMWAVVETFIDTIIICTITGLLILFTGAWTLGGPTASLVPTAMSSVLGEFGRYICVICLILFALSSILTDITGLRIQAVSMFNNRTLGIAMQIVAVFLIVAGASSDIQKVFLFADFGNGFVVVLNIIAMILLGGQVRKLTKEWFDHRGNMEEIMADREKK